MSKSIGSKSVALSSKIYERLLALYPKSHREKYGSPMGQLFCDQCRDAWSNARGWGLTVLWMRVLVDLLKTSTEEHLRNLKQRKSVLGKLRFDSFRNQLWDLRVAWLFCIMSPLPAMLLWRSQDGRCIALWCFCAGCFSVTAYSFRPGSVSKPPVQPWLLRMIGMGAVLAAAWVMFSLLWILLVDPHDIVALFVGFQILIPSFCVVPYLTLATRRPFAAVVFSAFLLGCMKGVAGVTVNFVYGWGNGHHEMPWTTPNLMLSTFWVTATILCILCHLLGSREFRIQCAQAAGRIETAPG
jgi:hypothetical protein